MRVTLYRTNALNGKPPLVMSTNYIGELTLDAEGNGFALQLVFKSGVFSPVRL